MKNKISNFIFYTVCLIFLTTIFIGCSSQRDYPCMQSKKLWKQNQEMLKSQFP